MDQFTPYTEIAFDDEFETKTKSTALRFIVDVDVYEGPLDLLLTLARTQKVDLACISVLALAEQYLNFISEAHRLRIDLAAEYLVMAAWLAYLKSLLLVPEKHSEDEPSGEDLASALAFRLQRLDAMRNSAAKLMARDQLQKDVWPRGMPEPIVVNKTSNWSATLYDLLAAYVVNCQKHVTSYIGMHRRKVWTLAEAREILTKLLGTNINWLPIENYLLDLLLQHSEQRTSILASTFSASLELVKEGTAEIHQQKLFESPLIRFKEQIIENEFHRQTNQNISP